MFLNWKLEVRLQVVNSELFLEFAPQPQPNLFHLWHCDFQRDLQQNLILSPQVSFKSVVTVLG